VALTPEQKASFVENGFLVVRNLLSPSEAETLRRRADDLATGRVSIPQGELVGGRMTGVVRRKPGSPTRTDPTTQPLPEVMLTERHARRGDQIYPVRQRPIDETAWERARADGDPFVDVVGMEHLADHDEVFRSFASHPNVVAVLRELIGPNVKLFFDHLYHKGAFAGPNRYHQDGFFAFTESCATCWIALDEVTIENGCLHYIPETAGYGQFRFDQLGNGITARDLEMEEVVPLHPGDAAFHSRWCIHATGPNNTARGRRGWAVHYTSAKSRFVYDPTFTAISYVQTPDGRHLRDDVIDGNRHYRLVSGREFPGCV
jgi:ectoine hydroxylase-related dioxygenase (phytanoyl-CoA dioxygenase family)